MKTIGFLNPYCSGGRGLKKWEKISSYFSKDIRWYRIDCNGSIDPIIKNSFMEGEINFIAAGGDGTVNYVLNKLLKLIPEEDLKNIKLGAAGIGSSNDFHKPFSECTLIEGIPVKTNFEAAEFRDIGCISFEEKGILRHKYFLINASIGITAEANHFFNNPDLILKKLKKTNTGLSILYSALKTILKYKNFDIKIKSAGTGELGINLTNLGIVKNPNFSGNLRYNSVKKLNSGKFDIHLCYGMSMLEIISLFNNLQKGSFYQIAKKRCWQSSEIKIFSNENFFIEFDGEIIKTNSAVFEILPKLIKVCSC